MILYKLCLSIFSDCLNKSDYGQLLGSIEVRWGFSRDYKAKEKGDREGEAAVKPDGS